MDIKKELYTNYSAIAPANAGGETRTRTKLPPSDFESDASAIPPHQQHTYNIIFFVP